jgi:transposase
LVDTSKERMFTMGNKRREFTPEFKDEAVKLVINTGRPTAVVARELGIVEQTLGNWVEAYRIRHVAGDEALPEAERAELMRLRKEVSELKLDRAFLKKPPSPSPRKHRIRTGSTPHLPFLESEAGYIRCTSSPCAATGRSFFW